MKALNRQLHNATDRFLHNATGAAGTEYAIMLAMVAIVATAAILSLGHGISAASSVISSIVP